MTTINPLDALPAINDGFPAARWNFPDAVGTLVSAPGGIGNGAEVTFSFMTAVPEYYTGSDFSTAGFDQFSAAQQQAVRDILSFFADVTQLKFTEVSTGGNLSFGLNTQNPNTAGYGFFPNFSYGVFSDGEIASVTMKDVGGDVWLNSSKPWVATDFSLGGTGYGALVHEIGHAVGLKHPFEANTGDSHILDVSLSNTQYTVMAYTRHPHGLFRTVTETTPGHFSWSYKAILPETLMPLDIQALQYLYGANTNFHATGDIYTFETDRPFIKTIYDAGGNDTISVANFSLGSVIDLRDGHYSSITIPSDALPDGATEPNADIYDGTDNLAIAYGTIIENAIGGSGDDSLIGNAVANRLTGGEGADTLDGGLGVDTMIGGDGSDIYYVDNKGDVVTENNANSNSGGIDLVNSSLAGYTLGANVENGKILSTGWAKLFGNGLNNTLYAGTGSNTLDGGAGNDTVSYAFADAAVKVTLASNSAQATGGSGSDTLLRIENLTGSTHNDKLTGNGGNNLLDGGLGNDTLTGGQGNDTLDGGLGGDMLVGGQGSDVYVIDAAADKVNELAGQGIDTILSTVSYSLVDTDGSGSNGGNVENLTLTGSAAINGTGNKLGNTLTGNSAANILTGNTGNDNLLGGGGGDQLIGGLGQDTLTGEAGADVFKFNSATETGATASTRDIIADFSHSQGDKIDLSAIDASTASGNNAFSDPTAGDTFSGVFANQGELYFDLTAHVLYGNNDSDSAADFSIQLTGINDLFVEDFVL